MANFSPYLANKIARWLNGNAMPSAPANLYVGLWDGNPLGAGVEVGDDITGGALRVVLDQDTVANDGADNTLTTDAVADFGASASATPVDVDYITIHDAISAGNILFVKLLDTPRTVNEDDNVRVQSGDLTITITKAA